MLGCRCGEAGAEIELSANPGADERTGEEWGHVEGMRREVYLGRD